MIIKALVENTSASEDLKSEHGLSLYIETKNHKLLFDTGATALFAENAGRMGVDLTEVDLVFISHGHYDHGGGLRTFLGINSKAKIYLNRNAFARYYSERANGVKVYIGLDYSLLPNDRFVFTGSHLIIDEELELFSDVEANSLIPSCNKGLLMKSDKIVVPDDFAHEQNLIIRESGKTVLIAGCAHKGIVNIIQQFHRNYDCLPSHVIGGFHLYNSSKGKSEDPALVSDIGAHLLKTSAAYYTCHCTGVEAYKNLKSIMRDKINYLSTGDQLII